MLPFHKSAHANDAQDWGLMTASGKFFLFFFILFPFSHNGIALADQPSAVVPISLSEAVRKAIQNNIALQVERQNIHLQEAGFRLASGIFDPTISFDLRADRTVRSSTSLIETAPSGTNRIIQENQRLIASINQHLSTGGDLGLSFRQFRSQASFQAVNPTLNGDLVLSFTQPLLQGGGKVVTEGPIRIANTDIAISQSVFEAEISKLILNVSEAYWDLVFQIKNLKVQQQTLESAKKLNASIQEKVKLGILSPIEILVAESSVASREEAVFIAQKGVFDTEDTLRMLLNLPEQTLFNPPALHPSDPPTDKIQHFEAETLLQTAFQKRPELMQNKLLFQNQSLTTQIAKDKLSPSLDLVGRIGLNGLGKDFSDETDQIGSGSFHQWEAGLVLRFPIGNQTARAELQRERINLQQTQLNRKKILQEITLKTKEGLRRVQTDFQRIKATRRARLLAKEKLSAGHERFDLGLISSQDLLEFQDDLAHAKGNELSAIIDYNKSLVNLEDVTGTLLTRYQVEILSR